MTALPLWKDYQVAAATRGRSRGSGEWSASGLSIDTRTLRPGDIFVAIEAERDGHDFVPQAFNAGASAALVSLPLDEAIGPQIVVNHTLTALESLAAAARDRNFGKLIGVTGSAGKTTTKEMLRMALAPAGNVHAADKSFNNHLGVPLTLAALPAKAPVGVFEMGMNHAGEIRGLTTLVRPHVAVITTIAAAHLEFLGSMEAIADAKAEIAEGIRPGGSIVLPADSPYIDRLIQRTREAGAVGITTFGETGREARIESIEMLSSGLTVKADILGQPICFRLHAEGAHMASNAVAALLAAALADVDVKDAAEALEAFRPGGGRGATSALRFGDMRVEVIDESYNANPASMRATLGVLAGRAPLGRKIAILGEMRELGPDAAALHADLAPDAASAADIVHTAGPMMEHLRAALPAGKRGTHTENAEDLFQVLLANLQDGDLLLFKGSNASRVGPLVARLAEASKGT
ncbi:MAG: UDP-N-acetylmuramoyl-tripeptide--D-alanyl-D-alanine ligase [Pseudomonadota bacterium]